MKKKAAVYRHFSHYCPAYPNEADTNYYKKKLLDILAGLLSGVLLTFSIVAISALF